MKNALYPIWQCTWGFLQSLLGFAVFLAHIRDRRYFYNGAVITEWKNPSSVSLGMFIFITKDPYYRGLDGSISKEELAKRLLTHEYGHTVQSAILGPLYLIIMGIPSTLWGFLPCLNKMRKEKSISYFSFFTEKWADALGSKVLKQKAMQGLKID